MEQLEVTQNKRQNAWQQFQTTKGKTKKVHLDIFASDMLQYAPVLVYPLNCMFRYLLNDP